MAHPHTARRLRIGRLVALLVATGLTVGGVVLLHYLQVRRQAGAILARADAAAEKEDWPAAVRLYQSYLNFHPQDAAAVARYAGAMEGVAKTRPATARQLVLVYERLLSLDADLADQRRRLARHYLNLGLLSACRSHLKILLAAPDAELHEMAAACDERERKFADAADHYRKAIATGQAGPDTSLRFALMLYERVGTPDARDEAAKVMTALVGAAPADIPRRLARARFYARTGDARLAREDAGHAYRNIPGGAENADVVLVLAELAAADGDYAAAQTVLAAAAGKVSDSRIPIALANAQFHLDDPDAAAETLKSAAAAVAGANPVLAEIAERLIDLGDPTTAAAQVERLAADERFRAVADYLTGRVRLAEGNWPEAAKKFRAAVDRGLGRHPAQHVNAYVGLAECYRLANNPDRRLRAANDALGLDPLSVPANVALAESLAAVGKRSEAMTVYAGLLGPGRPRDVRDAARLAVCQLKLAEILDQPEGERNFAALDDLIGPPPHPTELFLVKVSALVAQNRVPDALAALEQAAAKAPGLAGVWAALALVQGGHGDPAGGLAALDRAERAIVDRVDFRIARAQLLARSPAPDAAAIRALADNAAGFSKADRYRLQATLGGLLTALGRPADAAALYRQAAAEMPYDLPARLALFDLAVAERDAALQGQVLQELRAIEGPDGPTGLVAEASRDLAAVRPGDAARIDDVRRRVLKAREQRESWPRVHAQLGDLDLLDGRGDAALDHYRRAAELGERSEAVVRNLVRLLLDRNGHAEALATLSRLGRAAVLPPDLQAQLTALRSAFGDDPGRNLAWARSPRAAGSRSYRDHLVRAAVLATAGDTTAARGALETAVSLRPESADVWVSLVRFLAANGHPRDAEAAAAQAVAKARPEGDTPADRAALAVALGTCREVLGDAAQAEARYREAVRADPVNIPAHDRLASLLYRTDRRADADAMLRGLIDQPPTADLRRWARRTLALAAVAQPGGSASLAAARALVDANLAEGDLLDDQRAKALVLAADPFQRDESVKLLTASRTVPLTPDQAALLARLQMQSGRYDLAEVVLRESTRATHLVPPEHLALLVRVQLTRGNPAGARETVERLRAAAPKSWLATAEHCRVLAAEGKAAEAVRQLRDLARSADAADRVGRIGPLLEELKATDEARLVYDQSRAGNPSPTGHAPLAQFHVRTGKPEEAVKLAFEYAATAPVGATARLLAAAARSRPPQLAGTSAPAGWADKLTEIDAWVAEKSRANPADLELLFAKAELDDLFGRYDDALAAYERGLAAAPDHPILLNNHATLLALHRRDASDRPRDEIERVIARHGYQPAVLDSRGVIHLVADRHADAERDLRAAVSLDPRPAYLFHLAQVLDRRAAENRDYAGRRDDVIRQARAAGLTKAMLHPKEWGEYDRLMGTQ